jgi:hypothetical protein
MKKKITFSLIVVLILTMVFGTIGASAAVPDEPSTFWISAYHFIKGDEIDLTRAAPVNIQVIKDGVTTQIVNLQYRQRFEATLPTGVYEFKFMDANTGEELFSCGTYDFVKGDIVHMQAHEQGPSRTPNCYVKID